MDYSIGFRPFEERDVDFIYQCKNDEKLNNMIVGQYRKYSREDAEQWVKGVIRADREDMKFWAICTNDEEKRIVGWVSLSNIDRHNRSVCLHGLVIGDKNYRDGTAMFEAMFQSMKYAFHDLGAHRVYGTCFSDHHTSPHLMNALGFQLEGIEKDAFWKNGSYHDILDFALLEDEFEECLQEGRYCIQNLIKLFIKSLKNNRK